MDSHEVRGTEARSGRKAERAGGLPHHGLAGGGGVAPRGRGGHRREQLMNRGRESSEQRASRRPQPHAPRQGRLSTVRNLPGTQTMGPRTLSPWGLARSAETRSSRRRRNAAAKSTTTKMHVPCVIIGFSAPAYRGKARTAPLDRRSRLTRALRLVGKAPAMQLDHSGPNRKGYYPCVRGRTGRLERGGGKLVHQGRPVRLLFAFRS